MHRIDMQNIHDVEVADLNGDGRLDVVCRDQSAFGASGKRGSEIFAYYQIVRCLEEGSVELPARRRAEAR